MFKTLIFILVAFSFAQAYEVCSEKGDLQYICPDGYGCCSDTTCGVYCSGGSGGFPWYGYVLIGVGVVVIIGLIIICPKLCKKNQQQRTRQRQQQQQQQLLQA